MHKQNRQGMDGELAVSALRHRFTLILAATLLGVGGGWLYGQAQPPSYESTASVLINPVEGNAYAPAGRNDELVSLETEAQIVRSDAVLQLVSERIPGSPAPRLLERRLHVNVPVNTQILDISYDAPDAAVARDTAQAFATAYLEHRLERAQDVTATAIAGIDEQITTVLADLRDATTASRRGDDNDRAFHSQLAKALNAELINLRAQRTTLAESDAQPGRIISPAALASGAGPARELVPPVSGGAAGLLAGLLLAMVVERRRGRIWAEGAVEATGVPVLASVRARAARRNGAAGARDLDEAVRRVRAAVLDHSTHGGSVTVACCSKLAVEPGLAAALAASLAAAGKDVILVDADRPVETAGDRWSPGAAPGLTDLLAGRHRDAPSLLVDGDNPGVKVLPGGQHPTAASDHFVRDNIAAKLSPLAGECDFLVLRAPSLQSTQGEAIARASSLTVVVVTSGRTRRSELLDAVQRLHGPETRLLGAVLLPRRRGVTWGRSHHPTERSARLVVPAEAGVDSIDRETAHLA